MQLQYDQNGNPLSPSLPPPYMTPGQSTYDQPYGSLVPGQPMGDSDYMDPAAFQAPLARGPVSSSGISGTGNSGQPMARSGDGEPTQAAGNLLARGPAKQPPPGVQSGPQYSSSDDESNAAQTAPAQKAPPGYTPNPLPDQITSRMEDRAQKMAATTPGNNWGQRLAMAVLSATKLAPFAMQIVHPEYSQQMGAMSAQQKQDEEELKGVDSAESAKANAQYRAESGQRQLEQGANYQATLDEKAEQAQTKALVARQADFTRSLGKPEDLIEHLSANDPQIPQLTAQGWQILDDIRYPEGSGMKVARPPASVQVTPQNQNILVGHHPGDLVPWSEYKSSLAAFQKAQSDLAVESVRAGAKTQDNEQQFVSEYQRLHPGSSIAEAQHAYAANHQAPERAPLPSPQQYVVPDGQGGHKLIVVAPGGTVPEGAVSQSGFSSGNVPTSQMRSRGEMAKTVTAQVPQILNDIDALKAKIGPVAGRWNQLWVNKGGMDDPDFAGLDQDLKMLASGILIIHFGMRGNAAAREALEKNFGEAQSPEDLKSRIQHADKWLDGYANATNAPGAAPSPGRGGTTQPSGGGLLQRYGLKPGGQ